MIAIVPYRTKWPDEFLALGKGLRQVLGDLALRIDHIGSTSVPGLAAKDIIDIQVTVRSLEPEIDQALMRAGYERLTHINLVSTHSPDIRLPEKTICGRAYALPHIVFSESFAPGWKRGAKGDAKRWHYQKILNLDHIPPESPTDPLEWTKWLFKSSAPQRPVNIHMRVTGRANQRYPLLFRDYLRTHSMVAQAYGQVKSALAGYHPDDIDAYYDVKDPVCDIIIDGAKEWATASRWEPGPSDC